MIAEFDSEEPDELFEVCFELDKVSDTARSRGGGATASVGCWLCLFSFRDVLLIIVLRKE